MRVAEPVAAWFIEPSGVEACADLLHLDVARRPRLVAARCVQPYGAVVEKGADDIEPTVLRGHFGAADRAAYGEADEVIVGHASSLHG